MLTSLFLVDMTCVLMICIHWGPRRCYEIRALCWYSRYVILRWRLQHKSACNKSDPLQNQTRNPYIVIHWSLLFICGYEILVICYLLYIILLSTILFIFFSFLFCFLQTITRFYFWHQTVISVFSISNKCQHLSTDEDLFGLNIIVNNSFFHVNGIWNMSMSTLLIEVINPAAVIFLFLSYI